MTSSHPPRGISLIELLIVVAMMGILAAVALPTLSPGAYEELQATAHIVAGDMAYGRSLAVANNSRYRYSFDVSKNRYILQHSGSNSALNTLPPAASRSPSDPANQHITDLGKLPRLSGQNVRLAGITNTAGTAVTPAELEYGPLGETTQSQDTLIWLAAGLREVRYVPIQVNPVTGIATIGEYTAVGPK